LEVECRLAFGLNLRLDDLLRFVSVGGLEAGALAGGLVHAIEHSAAVATAGQMVTGLHFIHANARIIQTASGK
jgi:hypothetical protein